MTWNYSHQNKGRVCIRTLQTFQLFYSGLANTILECCTMLFQYLLCTSVEVELWLVAWKHCLSCYEDWHIPTVCVICVSCLDNVDSFVVIIWHNLDSGKTLQNIYCLWTNMAEIWPTYFQINFLQKGFLRILSSLFGVGYFFRRLR